MGEGQPRREGRLAVIKLTLPYPISANRYWRTFAMDKRAVTVPSAEAKAYKRHVAQIALAAGIKKPLIGRVAIDIRLYPARPLDWQKRMRQDGATWDDSVRCIDLDNARKVLYDALKGVVIEDDKWVFRDSGVRMEPDGVARVEVRITSIEIVEPQTDLFGALA
jgi:crossover junction endodeoxyribonuclease RusA